MTFFTSRPRKVKLHHDSLLSPLQFDSCEDAIEFLWHDVRKRSIKIGTVRSTFHKKSEQGKPIYGYRIEKDKDYVHGVKNWDYPNLGYISYEEGKPMPR